MLGDDGHSQLKNNPPKKSYPRNVPEPFLISLINATAVQVSQSVGEKLQSGLPTKQ